MERIKGFTIELELDSIKVDAGLKDLRSSMRLMNSEMRKNMSSFDWGERSLRKYGIQLDGLNKKLELQKTVTESARKHYEKMVAEHGEGSRQANNAAAAYNHEAAQLNNLERHIQKVTSEMREFQRQQMIQNSTLYQSGEALISFGDGLDNISAKARSVGGTLTKYVTAPIAGLVATVGGMGFKRAMDIEQVQFMIDHITDTKEEADRIMDSVLDLVTDTSFGLAEIANPVAQFLGASADEMNSLLFAEVAMNLSSFKADDQLIPQIGDLFTKSLQSGKIDGQMINQFTNAGVDILKVLGNEWGMEADAVRETLREGNFDIEDVLVELSHGIMNGTKGVAGETKAMGGMIEKSGMTLSGKIKNAFAAISTRGAELIQTTGLFDGVKDALDELRNMLRSGELDAVLLPTFQGLAKALEALVDIARKVFKWFSNLSDTTKEWIGNFVGISAIIGPVLVGLGVFGGIIAKISTGLGKFLKLLAPLMVPLKKIGAAAGSAGKSAGLLSRAFTFLSGPIGIAIGVITVLTTAFVTAYKKSETFRDFVHKMIGVLKELGKTIYDSVTPIFETFTDILTKTWDRLKEFWEVIQPKLTKAFGVVGDFITEVFEKITGFWDKEGSGVTGAIENIANVIHNIAKFIWSSVSWVIDQILNIIEFSMPLIEWIVESVWGNIKGYISGALDFVLGLVKTFSGLFTGDFEKMWEGIKQMFSGYIEALWNFINLTLIGRIVDAIGEFVGWIVEKLTNMWESIVEKWENVVEYLKDVFTPVTEFFSNIWNSVSDNINEVWEIITETLSVVWENIKTIASETWEIIKNVILGPILLLINLITGDFEEFKENLSAIWENIKESASEIWESFTDIVTSIIEGFVDGVKKIWEGLKEATSKAFNWIKDRISNIWTSSKNQVSNTLDDMKNGVKNKFTEMRDSVKERMDRVYSTVKNLWNRSVDFIKDIDLKQIGKDAIDGLINGIKSKVKAVGDAVKNVTGAITGRIKKILKISSPSKLLEQFGSWTGEGLEIGIKGSVKGIDRAADEMAIAAIPNMKSMDRMRSFVSSSEKRTDAMKLLALIGKKLSNHPSPDVFSDTNESNEITELLNATVEQNTHLQKVVELLILLLDKDNNTYLDKQLITKLLAPGMSKEINDLNRKGARKQGVIT